MKSDILNLNININTGKSLKEDFWKMKSDILNLKINNIKSTIRSASAKMSIFLKMKFEMYILDMELITQTQLSNYDS